jgi:hypothetical protein
MVLKAHMFTMVTDSAAEAGLALVCFEARYGAMLWRDSRQIARLQATAEEWREIEHQIRNGLDPRPLPASSPLAAFLRGGEPRQARWLAAAAISVDDPLATVEALDEHLRHAAERG